MANREKRILIVDDDAAIRALLQTILRRRGFAVDTAQNGAEAMERIERSNYALLLLDLMMPRMNGWQVLDELRDRTAPPPLVIVLTAGTEPRALASDFVAGTIRKPFDVDLLVDTVAACMSMLPESEKKLDGCRPLANEGDNKTDSEILN